MEEKKYKKISDIPHSKYVEIEEDKNTVKIIIKKPTENMQTDMANFEALAIMYKCINPSINVIIEYTNYEKWDARFGDLSSESSIYSRFLYRLIKFREAFPSWVKISNNNIDEINFFEKLLNEAFINKKLSNNIPESKAGFNPNKGEEHQIENKLARTEKGNNYLKDLYHTLYPSSELLFAYNQLPNGLFNISHDEKANESKRVFTTGMYDIWGIDTLGNLCIFELKNDKGNSHLGVISELFFYAIYANEILCNKDLIHKKKDNNYRGYEKLYDYVQIGKINGINAIFLLGQDIYPAIKERQKELKMLLDTNTFGINFDFLIYDINEIEKIDYNEIEN